MCPVTGLALRVVRGAVSLALLVVVQSHAFSPSALAQETVGQSVDLPQINVKTSKVPTAAEKTAASPPVNVVAPTTVPTPSAVAPSSVTVITAADIAREQRRTLPDALSTVPGLNIVQTGGPGGQTSVFMRGTNSNHVKVLIDGIDVSDASNPNRSFDFGHMLTEDIERIEVLRGPQSGLYGSDAIGGVISITTKTGKGPPQAVAILEGGSFGTFNQMGSLRGSHDRFSYSVNVQHFRSQDTPVTPDRLLPPGRPANGNFYENETYSTKLGYDFIENFAVNVMARYTDALLRFTGDSGFPGVPNARQSTQVNHQFFSRSEAVWSLFDGRFKNYFGFNYTDHWNYNRSPDPSVPTVNKGERTKYDWRGVITPMRGLTFVMGLEKENENLRTDTIQAENGNKAGYLEMQAQFADRIFLTANGRYDDNESFGGHGTYRIAPSVLLPVTETKLKASYGTGFKAPTLNQLFVSFPDFFFFANPNLKPEISTGYDVGFEQPLFNDRVRFGTIYFHNDITNLINTVFNPVTFISTLDNVDRAKTYGWETFISVAVTERLKVRADHTYTRAFNDLTGDDLLRRPRNKYSVSAVWNPMDPLTVTATVLRVGSWDDVDRSTFVTVSQKGYTVVNVASNYVVNKNLTAFARIDNLFDQHYEDPNGFLRPGIGVFGGARVSN